MSFIFLTASLFAMIPPGADEIDTSSVHLSFSFTDPEILMTGEFHTVSIGDLPLAGGEGQPTLPCRPVKVLLPPGTEYSGFTAHHSEAMVAAISKDLELGREEVISGGEIGPRPPMALGPQIVFPGDTVRYTGTHLLHGLPVATFTLHPVSYDAVTGAVMFHEKLDLVVHTSSSDERSLWSNPERFDGEVVENPWTLLEYQGPANGPESALAPGSHRYVIITSDTLAEGFEPLLDWKRSRGADDGRLVNTTAALVTVEWISSNPAYWGDPTSHKGTGNDTQNQIRNFIKDAYWTWGTEHVLLGGDTEIIPCRYVPVVTSLLSSNIPADAYYAGLDGTWDADGDGRYGEGGGKGGGLHGDEADLLFEVNVGRAPVGSMAQVENFVSKVISYESVNHAYLNTSLMVGEKLDNLPTWGGDYKDIVAALMPDDNPQIGVERLYDRDKTFSKLSLISALNEGVHLVNHIGHGSESKFAEMGANDVASLSNDLLFILYTQACHVGAFDGGRIAPQDCVMEHMVNAEGGAVATVANSREGWYQPGGTSGPSQMYDIEFFKVLFDEGVRDIGRVLSNSKMNLLPLVENTGTMRWCYMSLNLLGDPEMEVHFLETRETDVGVVSIDAGELYKGEGGSISALIGNFGESDESDIPVELYADGALVSTSQVTVPVGEVRTAVLPWTPTESKFYQVRVQTNLSADPWKSNDALEVVVEVLWRISGDETISVDHVQRAGVLIEPGGRLGVTGSTLLIDAPVSVSITVRGHLDLVNATVRSNGPQGYHIQALEESTVTIAESTIMGATGGQSGMMIRSSSVVVEGLIVIDSHPFQISHSQDMLLSALEFSDSGGLTITDCGSSTLDAVMRETTGGLLLDSSWGLSVSVDITNASTGLLMRGCSEITIHDSRISGCSVGMQIDRSTGSRLLNVSLSDNLRDLGIEGEVIDHFAHTADDSSVSQGNILIISEGSDFEIGPSAEAGYVAVISSSDGRLHGLHLGGNMEGLLIVNSTSIEVTNSSFFQNQVGLRGLWSSGCLVYGNDFVSNDVHAWDDGLNRYNSSYPEGGNFWEDHPTPDDYSGPDQLSPGADGIGDNPYLVAGGGNADYLPLVRSAIEENVPPQAGFSHSPSPALTYQTIQFLDLSSDEDGDIIAWIWDFGDGSTSHERHPSHSYPEDGIYHVTLTVMDDSRNLGSITRPVEVQNRAPFADFGYTPLFPRVGESVSFTDRSSDLDGEIVGWYWDFGDGNASIQKNPVHSFSMKGDYTVTLLVTDDGGLTASASGVVVVGNEFPQAAFSYSPERPTVLDTVSFTDLSTDPDGSVVWWRWDFGDGRTSGEPSPSHRYSSIGHYTVTLTIKDDKGASGTHSRTIEVVNAPPVAEMQWFPAEPSGGIEVQFVDLSSDPDGSIESWYWDFGDGNTSDEKDPTHAFAAKGEYDVSLTVWDDRGASSTVTHGILVRNSLPVASFNASAVEVYTFSEVLFIDSSYDIDGMIIEWEWDFGDGRGSGESSPTHLYEEPGRYEVTLTVRDNDGGEDSMTILMTVLNRPPLVDFIWSVDDPDMANTIRFTGNAEDMDGSIVEVGWDFGDGSTSQELSPEHVYDVPGEFSVTFWAVDDMGAESSVTRSVTVELDTALALLHIDEGDGKEVTVLVRVLCPEWYKGDVTLEAYINGVLRDSITICPSSDDQASFALEVDEGENLISIVIVPEDGMMESDQGNKRLDLSVNLAGDNAGVPIHWLAILAVIIGAVLVLIIRRK